MYSSPVVFHCSLPVRTELSLGHGQHTARQPAGLGGDVCAETAEDVGHGPGRLPGQGAPGGAGTGDRPRSAWESLGTRLAGKIKAGTQALSQAEEGRQRTR